jgi:protoheme ferro-lyase
MHPTPYHSAHGVPESYIEAGDPYQRHIEECVRLISREVSEQLTKDNSRPDSISREMGAALAGSVRLNTDSSKNKKDLDSEGTRPTQFHLSFQSRVGPVQWLK